MTAAAPPRLRMTRRPKRDGDVLLGEDWVSPEGATDEALRAGRGRRGIVSLNRSPLARKIIIFNLMALVILVAGVLFMNPFRDSLVLQREQGLVSEARLIADVFEARMPGTGAVNMAAGDGIDVAETLAGIDLAPGSRSSSSIRSARWSGTGLGKASGRRPGRDTGRSDRHHRFPERGLGRRVGRAVRRRRATRRTSMARRWRARCSPTRAVGRNGGEHRRDPATGGAHLFGRHPDLARGRGGGRRRADLGRGRDRPAGAL